MSVSLLGWLVGRDPWHRCEGRTGDQHRMEEALNYRNLPDCGDFVCCGVVC
jgi:hypothetical protein